MSTLPCDLPRCLLALSWLTLSALQAAQAQTQAQAGAPPRPAAVSAPAPLSASTRYEATLQGGSRPLLAQTSKGSNDGLASEPAAGGALDPALVGRWVRESVINSSGGAGGFASLATQRTLTLASDGRARQTLRSAGGGSQWSHSSGEQVEFSGRWQVRGAELWVQPDGQAQFIQAARYALFDGRLVAYTSQGRQIWSR